MSILGSANYLITASFFDQACDGSEEVYVDMGHLNLRGNQIVTGRIVDAVAKAKF